MTTKAFCLMQKLAPSERGLRLELLSSLQIWFKLLSAAVCVGQPSCLLLLFEALLC